MSLTGDEVKRMENDLEQCRADLQAAQVEIAVISSRNERLERDNIKLRAERDDALVKATTVDTIVRQVSEMLVIGLKRMRSERREEQEAGLGVGGDDRPFQTGDRAPAKDARMVEGAPVAERIKDAVEAIVSPKRPGAIDETLADRDDRIPRVAWDDGNPGKELPGELKPMLTRILQQGR